MENTNLYMVATGEHLEPMSIGFRAIVDHRWDIIFVFEKFGVFFRVWYSLQCSDKLGLLYRFEKNTRGLKRCQSTPLFRLQALYNSEQDEELQWYSMCWRASLDELWEMQDDSYY